MPQMPKTIEIIESLKKDLAALFESDKYKAYLHFMSKLHPYSAYNILLLMRQLPTVSYVAPYDTWKENGRQVKKGEKALTIICPQTHMEEDAEGKPQMIVSFRARPCVFDVSQTVGDDLPDICKPLSGSLQDARLLSVLEDLSPVPVCYDTIPGDCNGYFSPSMLQIVVDKDLSDLMRAKTLIHEISHALLHGNGCEEEDADRRTREVQAESIAYTVLSYLGMDTAEYSFGYIAGWSADKTLPELRRSMDLIRRTADKIITALEEGYAARTEETPWTA